MTEEFNMDNYDAPVPFADIPNSDVVDEGVYGLRVRELKTTRSKDGKLMFVGFFLIEGGVLDGVNFPIQNYVIGTDDDPMARDPKTWVKSFGARQWNQLLEACRSPKIESSFKQTNLRAAQSRFHAYVTKSLQTTGDYKGSEQNKITRYGAFGEQMVVPGKAASPAVHANGTATSTEYVPRDRLRPNYNPEPAPVAAEDDIPA